MRELGEYLKQMRESRGVSLEEVARATKVNIRYLSALEEGQYDLLPPDVYVRGFLRAYAEYLGIDPEELYARYDAGKPKKRGGIFSRREPQPVPTTTISPGPGAAEVPTQPSKFSFHHLLDTLKAIPGVVYAFAGLVILVGVILIISLGGESEPPPQNAAEAILGDTTLQRIAAAPEDEDMSQAIKVKIDSVNAMQALNHADSLTFVVRAKAPVGLVYAEADFSKKLFRGRLRRGEKKIWRVENNLYIETSNPAALEISVNGFELKSLKGYYKITLGRDNIVRFLAEGYIPPPAGMTSAYGQRIESAGVDTVPGPPSERPRQIHPRPNTSNIALPPLAPKPASAESGTTRQSRRRIKPPKTNQLKPPSSNNTQQRQ